MHKITLTTAYSGTPKEKEFFLENTTLESILEKYFRKNIVLETIDDTMFSHGTTLIKDSEGVLLGKVSEFNGLKNKVIQTNVQDHIEEILRVHGIDKVLAGEIKFQLIKRIMPEFGYRLTNSTTEDEIKFLSSRIPDPEDFFN